MSTQTARCMGLDVGGRLARAVVDAPSAVSKILPLVVGVGARGNPVWGTDAKRQMRLKPDSSVYDLLYWLGAGFSEQRLARLKNHYAFTVQWQKSGEVLLPWGEKYLAAAELLAHLLSALRDMMQDTLEEEITRAVLSLPADLSAVAVGRLNAALAQTGLQLEQTLPRPIALASRAAWENADAQRWILDWNESGCEIALVQKDGGEFSMRSLDGDVFEGQNSIEEMVADDLMTRFQTADAAKDRLYEAVENALMVNNLNSDINIALPALAVLDGSAIDVQQSVSSGALQKRFAAQIHTTLCRLPKRLDSQTPLWFRGPPGFFATLRCDFPQAQYLEADAAAHGALSFYNAGWAVRPQLSRSLGFADGQGIFHRMLPRLCEAPQTVKKTLCLGAQNQSQQRFLIYAGESRKAEQNRTVGNFEFWPLDGKMAQVALVFHLPDNELLEVRLEDRHGTVLQKQQFSI